MSRHLDPDGASGASGTEDAAQVRRKEAAARYRPKTIKLLLVAEAPPRNLDEYFYFEYVPVNDDLFRHLARCVLGIEPTRENKPRLLRHLCEAGVFLIELRQEPLVLGDHTDLADLVEGLVARCRELAPQRIILIGATLYDFAIAHLRTAGIPVVDARVPYPVARRLNEFRQKLAQAAGDETRREPEVPPELGAADEPVPLIGAAQLAALLGVPQQRLHGLYHSGWLPTPIHLGGRRLWRPNELRDWIKAGRPNRSEWSREADGTWQPYLGCGGRPYPLPSRAQMTGLEPEPKVPDGQDEPLLVDAPKAAALLGISRSSLWRLHCMEQVPSPVRLGRRTLWSPEELRAWVRAGCPIRSRWEAMTPDRRSPARRSP